MGLSLVFALIAVAGFAPTYLAPVAGGRFDGPAILHLHGAVFFAWTVLLIVQARLARSSPQTHRALGLAGISLATAVVFMGGAVVVHGLAAAVGNGNESNARPLSVVPVLAILTFAVCFALAIANIRRPDTHKRFIVLATVALLPPAFARMLFTVLAPEGVVRPSLSVSVPDLDLALNLILVPAVLADLVLIAPIVYDWRSRGRPHAVYVIGGSCMLGLQLLRPFIARTDAWHSFTGVLLALAR